VDISDATAVEVAETSNADIKAEIASVKPDGMTITVNAGSISLHFLSDINADIEMKTSSGDIVTHSFWGITTSDNTTKGYVKGTIGTGGYKIYLVTSKGNIDLYRPETTQ
jgi:DUF4097 and DUF4098 domain-containing protein YvlB